MRFGSSFLGVLVVLGALAGSARASTVVVLSDPAQAAALASALQVALAGRGVAIATLAGPSGQLRLDRAAAAQHAAIELRADAALWIDVGPDDVEICAVSADGAMFRHVPVPAEAASPRVFAAIATSLLDELVAPTLAVAVPGAVGAGAPLAPPGVEIAAAPQPVPRVRADRSLLEIGPMVSPLSGGVEGEIALPVTPAVRLGLIGIANVLFQSPLDTLLGAGLEVRRVGRGRHHFDVGGLAGAAGADGDWAGFVGARLSYTWEGPVSGLSLSLSPVVLFADGAVVPGAWASLRWELPL